MMIYLITGPDWTSQNASGCLKISRAADRREGVRALARSPMWSAANSAADLDDVLSVKQMPEVSKLLTGNPAARHSQQKGEERERESAQPSGQLTFASYCFFLSSPANQTLFLRGHLTFWRVFICF